jgi:hypothetical protein
VIDVKKEQKKLWNCIGCRNLDEEALGVVVVFVGFGRGATRVIFYTTVTCDVDV